MAGLTVRSSAFENRGQIPKKYTCDGEEVNPPLTVKDIPQAAQSLVLVVDDPDAPRGTYDHWVVWNIPLNVEIEENSVPGVVGVNSAGLRSYDGMCPPWGTHRYFFKVYALDTKLDLKPDATGKKDLEKAMQGHILAKGELVGLYSRSK
ncbi:MAG: YbhB/YbcL family Raf kinase inhibitor-like protein [Candidatus Bathyarchaeota archaeon]|nr:YbhB/YbcL family Raf kinase inhibitor-like protein [Candidatus Bathyarchaeota archaeon]